MSMHKPHSSSLSDCVCNCVLERICGESEMSEMYVTMCPIPPNLDNWARWPISSSADAVIQRRDTSTLYNALHKEKYETNLHQTPSSYKRLLIRRSSPDCLQRQLLTHSPWAFWCPARHHFHASFGRKHVASPRPLHGVLETRQRLLTATYNIGVQCRIYSVRLTSYLKKCNGRIMNCLHNFIFYQSIILETNSRQNCFASSMLPSLLASKVEGNKHVLHMDRSTACLLATLSHGSLRNITHSQVFSIHSQQRVANIRCIGCIGLGPKGCTWMYMDVQRILTMRHLVARVPLSSCYGINRTRSTMAGSNQQPFMMLHDDSCFDPIWIAILWTRWRFDIST